MIVPPGLCALACIWFALADHTKRMTVSLDWLGFIALSVAIVAAQLIFDRGQRLDWFGSQQIVLSGKAESAFVVNERAVMQFR
jgi:DHA2 family multidrug resistance protein